MVSKVPQRLSENNLLITEQDRVSSRPQVFVYQSANPKRICGFAFASGWVRSPHISDLLPALPVRRTAAPPGEWAATKFRPVPLALRIKYTLARAMR